MAYSAMAVANAFIKRAKEGDVSGLSPMKLQKLMFYAQSWYLKLRNNAPLLDDVFCRWRYGPVIPSLYHEFKRFEADPVREYGTYLSNVGEDNFRITTPIVPDSDVNAWELIDEVIRVYGKLSGAQLSGLTHRPGSAWSEGLDGKEADGSPISNEQLFRQSL